MHALVPATLLVAVSLCHSQAALAACVDESKDFVAVRFDHGRPLSRVESERRRLERKVVEHLSAEFRPQGIEVCVVDSETAPAALATLQIERDASNEAFVRAQANDAVTQKELSRKLSLDGLPKDAHALAIALGASELLRASWVELRLETSPPLIRPVPKSVERVVEASEKVRPSSGSLGLELAAESFSGGLRQAGVNAKISVALGHGVQAVARVGGRSAMSATSSANGTVSADGWLISLGLQIPIAEPTPTFELSFLARADLMRVNFVGNAGRGAVATSAADLTSWAAAGLGLDIAMSRSIVLDGAILAGYVTLPVVAADNGMQVLGASEGLVAANVGIKIPF